MTEVHARIRPLLTSTVAVFALAVRTLRQHELPRLVVEVDLGWRVFGTLCHREHPNASAEVPQLEARETRAGNSASVLVDHPNARHAVIISNHGNRAMNGVFDRVPIDENELVGLGIPHVGKP